MGLVQSNTFIESEDILEVLNETLVKVTNNCAVQSVTNQSTDIGTIKSGTVIDGSFN